jgi:hypothetical protein
MLGLDQLQRTPEALEFSVPRSLWSKLPFGVAALARIRVHVTDDAGTTRLRVRGWYRLLEALSLVPAMVLGGLALGAPTVWGPLTMALLWALVLLLLHRLSFTLFVRRLARAIGRRSVP